jgi:hypothetical protein
MPLEWTNTGDTPVTMFGIEVAPGQTIWIANSDPQTSEITAGLLDDRGNYDASGNVWPSEGGSGTNEEILKGDLWIVSVSGTLGGKVVEVGDNVRALTDNPGQTASNWSILSTGLGFVPAAVTDSRFPNANQKASFDAATTLDATHPPLVKGTDAPADVSAVNPLRSSSELNLTYLRHLPAEYQASDITRAKTVGVAADRYKIILPQMRVDINGNIYFAETAGELSCATAAHWDTQTPTDHTTAGNRAGKDFYVYAVVPVSGQTPGSLLSAASTYPFGYTASNSRKIGGFHCLCASVDHATTLTAWAGATVIALGETRKATSWDGYIYRCSARTGDYKTGASEPNWAGAAVDGTITDGNVTWTKEIHLLEGYVAGDILPYSVWDLTNRPSASPEGMIWVPASTAWVDIYLPSGTLVTTASVNGGTITSSRKPYLHRKDFFAVNKRMVLRSEFIAAATRSPWYTRTAGGAAPTTTGGHTVTDGRRLVSDFGLEDGNAVCYQYVDNAYTLTNLSSVGGAWGDAPNATIYYMNYAAELTNESAWFSSRGASSSK